MHFSWDVKRTGTSLGQNSSWAPCCAHRTWLCAGDLNQPNCNRNVGHYFPALLHSMMSSDSEFHLHSPLWAVPTAIRNCGKNCSGIFLESGKTPQFSIGQWNPLQCAFQQKNSQPDLQCFFIFFNSWKTNSMLKLHFNWFSSLIWPQFTNADCLCQAFIHCFYFLSPACQ